MRKGENARNNVFKNLLSWHLAVDCVVKCNDKI